MKYDSVKDTYDIEKVFEQDDCYEIRTKQSWCFILKKKWVVSDHGIPKVGDRITVYSYQGTAVRGMTLHKQTDTIFYDNDMVAVDIPYFYKTDEELEAHRQEWLANYEREKKERFEKEKEKLDRDYASLPEAFQRRIQRFRNEDPNFRVDSESYEMFCCTEAVKIANHCQTPEGVEAFHKATWEEQAKVVDDGHSGNTFNGAVRLAYHYLKGVNPL